MKNGIYVCESGSREIEPCGKPVLDGHNAISLNLDVLSCCLLGRMSRFHVSPGMDIPVDRLQTNKPASFSKLGRFNVRHEGWSVVCNKMSEPQMHADGRMNHDAHQPHSDCSGRVI